jgi:hypothetical protein
VKISARNKLAHPALIAGVAVAAAALGHRSPPTRLVVVGSLLKDAVTRALNQLHDGNPMPASTPTSFGTRTGTDATPIP